MNHTADECYSKHGFPPWIKQRMSHVANAMDSETEKEKNAHNDTYNDQVLKNLDSEQLQQLVDMIQGCKGKQKVVNNSIGDFSKTNSTGKEGKSFWILDTRATDHVTCSISSFVNYYKIKPVNIKLPNNHNVVATHAETIILTHNITLHNVLYIPAFTLNNLFVQRPITSLKCKLIFTDNVCQIQERSTSKMIGQANIVNGLYHLHTDKEENLICFLQEQGSFEVAKGLNIWHCRMGHSSKGVLEKLTKQYTNIHSVDIDVCSPCHLAKQHKLPFPLSKTSSEHVFYLIHMDIWGRLNVHSLHGHKYFLTIVDDHSRYTWIHLMESKSETRDYMQHFIAHIKNQFNKGIKVIRTDNGKEFCWKDFYDKHGIIHQTSCNETPEQNSIVERKHQHILNIARCILYQSNLPNLFLSYAVLHSVHLINRLPSPVIQNECPYKLMYGSVPDLSNIKVFGCLCFASTLEQSRHKLDPRTRKCIFLGFKHGTKGYVVMDVNPREIFISRNVIFYETYFCNPKSENSDDTTLEDIDFTIYDVASPKPIVTEENTEQEEPRRSTRIKKPPNYLEDYHHSIMASPCSSVTQKSKVLYPLSFFISYKGLAKSHLKYALSISCQNEPQNYKEAKQYPEWREAMKAKIKALEENETWKIVELTPNKTAIGCKWIFRIKRKANGDIERYKVRLVAKGYTQRKGIDYMETYSPVARLTTIRTILAVASTMNWHLEQLNVNNAFLHDDLEEEVYMELPLAIASKKTHQVCRLMKSLYGLKQASKHWYDKLTSFLHSINFNHYKADNSLFVRNVEGSFIALLVYVDDILIVGNNANDINTVKDSLNTTFKIKDLGPLKFFLGLEIVRTVKGIHVCQCKYALEILADVGDVECKTW